MPVSAGRWFAIASKRTYPRDARIEWLLLAPLLADVRCTWPEGKSPEEVQTGYTEEAKKIIPLVFS